jgi:hypothetical protein
MSSRLKWCVVSVLPVLILSLAPQARLWVARGAEWNGAYAVGDGDEYLYSAYINALIDNRPRRNDPFSGRDNNPNAPLLESTFSIQFLPPWLISSFAKTFGLSASTSFIILIAFTGLSAAVAVFWVLSLHIDRSPLAALGTLIVLILGTAAAGQGLLAALFTENVSTLGLAFLRRYQPAAAFFGFFVFCGLVECAIRSTRRINRVLIGVLSGVALCCLVFSYLYLWTAAAAWVMTFTALALYFDEAKRRQAIEVIIIIVAEASLAAIGYFYLLSNRAHTLNETQTMISTHRPDLLRVPEILGGLIIIAVIALVRRKQIQLRQPSTIFALSFGVLPLLLFNQQVITGRSMQPFHFEHYIVNYAVLLGAVILLANFARGVSAKALAVVTSIVLLWGVAEVAVPGEIRNTWNTKNDQIVPVLLRLKALAATDGTLSELRSQGQTSKLVFSPDIDVLMLLPTWTAQGTMIGVGGLDFGSANFEERKVFAYLYYSGADSARLDELLRGRSNDLALNYYARSALFGHERVLPQLSMHRSVIQDSEIQEQLRAYDAYVSTFSQSEAIKHPFAYVIVPAETQFDFSRIDRWYERQPPERIGQFELYRVRMRT